MSKQTDEFFGSLLVIGFILWLVSKVFEAIIELATKVHNYIHSNSQVIILIICYTLLAIILLNHLTKPEPKKFPPQCPPKAKRTPKRTFQKPVNYAQKQLENVEKASPFSSQSPMNRTERIAYDTIRETLLHYSYCKDFNIVPQVSLGAVLQHGNDKAHRAINSKRCDFFLFNRNWRPESPPIY